MKKHCTAIVLAAGQGTRMNSEVLKPYLEIDQKPLIYYSLKVFQESGMIDDIVLVAKEGQTGYVQDHIVEKYRFTKVAAIVEGGRERYDSVWAGLQAVNLDQMDTDWIIFIHDGARALIDEPIIERAFTTVQDYDVCVVGMPVKDTIKIADEKGFVKDTPDRKDLWQVQTPQVFKASIVKEAYRRYIEAGESWATDDCMVVERMLGHPVKLVTGSYENIKITTPEDLPLAEYILNNRK